MADEETTRAPGSMDTLQCTSIPVQESDNDAASELERLRAIAAEAEASKVAALAKAAAAESRADALNVRLHAVQLDNERLQSHSSACREVLQQVHEEVKCPIGHELLQEPAIAADGHSYERRAITRWLDENGTSPMTGLQLDSRALVPNLLAGKVANHLRGKCEDLGVGTKNSQCNGEASTSSANPQEEILPGALLEAAVRGDRQGCLTMLASGVPDINAKLTQSQNEQFGRINWGLCPSDGATVLHIAAAQRWPDVCRAVLMAAGFNEHQARNRNGHSALWYACACCFGRVNEEVCRVLEQSGIREA